MRDPVDLLRDKVVMINWNTEIALSTGNRSHFDKGFKFHFFLETKQAIVAFLKDYYCVVDTREDDDMGAFFFLFNPSPSGARSFSFSGMGLQPTGGGRL